MGSMGTSDSCAALKRSLDAYKITAGPRGGSMAIIFVSHSSSDDAFARQLSNDLELIGHTPWMDDLDIRPGESIPSAIQDGLSKARYGIVIVSQAALSSNWVDAEWKEKFWDTLKAQKARVIPVMKEKCELPQFLRTLSYADFTKSYAV